MSTLDTLVIFRVNFLVTCKYFQIYNISREVKSVVNIHFTINARLAIKP